MFGREWLRLILDQGARLSARMPKAALHVRSAKATNLIKCDEELWLPDHIVHLTRQSSCSVVMVCMLIMRLRCDFSLLKYINGARVHCTRPRSTLCQRSEAKFDHSGAKSSSDAQHVEQR